MSEWEFIAYELWEQAQCINCGRMRVNSCINGKHRCEKCDYSPELGRVVTDEELEPGI